MATRPLDNPDYQKCILGAKKHYPYDGVVPSERVLMIADIIWEVCKEITASNDQDNKT